MRMAISKERRTNERRVAASPDTVKKYRGLGLEAVVETRAGDGASIPDKAFADAGAEIAPDAAAAYDDADVVLKVRHPTTATEGNDELALMKRGAVLIGILNPYGNRDMLPTYAEAGVTALAMELVPRITRAQSMDVLSSQANLAGYRAVLDAASELPLIGCPSAAPCSSPT
jgi:NAD(P) transhydrogenase subunit alpha